MNLLLLFAFFVLSSLIFPHSVLAQATKSWSQINGKCVGTGLAAGVPTIQGFECLFYNVLQVVTAIAGLAFFVMLIVGGFNYIFSNGDDKQVATAASTLTMAVVGLVGVIASWFILHLIQDFTGVNVTNFVIPN